MEGGKFFNRYKPMMVGISIGLLWMFCATCLWAGEANQLKDFQIRPIDQNKVQILLEFSQPIHVPKSFSVEAPPTLVFDFASVKNKISKELINQPLKGSVLKNVNIVETDNKTRMIIDVKEVVPFETAIEGHILKITLDESNKHRQGKGVRPAVPRGANAIQSVDFHRGERGEARLMVKLSNPKAAVDFKEENGKIWLEFMNASLADKWVKRYDVTDFATPVQMFEVSKNGSNVDMVVEARGEYDKIAYQIDNEFILEVRGTTQEKQAAFKELTGKYTGEKLSLNFQDIEVRAVLQIIADFSGFNLITGDSVKGNVTLRLQNVPWDQALDIILQSKGLDKRRVGNVMLIAPSAEIAAREKTDLEGQKNLEQLGPLKSELIQINYAVADTMATMLKDKANSLLTSRGSVSVDKRTNTLLVQDVAQKLDEIRALLTKLDIPVRQVEISTQIVTADNSLESRLGMRFGGGASLGLGHRRLGVGSTIDRGRAIADFQDGNGKSVMPPSNSAIAASAYNTGNPTVNNTEGLFSDLGVTGSNGVNPAKLGLALAKLPNGTLLDLELQALEYESKSKTIARPKIVTMDQNKATVEQGFDIPYNQSTSSGATSVAFKTAALKLEVTPQITPDNKVSMDVMISNDSVGDNTPTAGPTIKTSRMQTKVLVDNGETVVLGGVLNITDTKNWAKVPFFGDLPIIGALFRNRNAAYTPKELIIFLTPKIITPLAKVEAE